MRYYIGGLNRTLCQVFEEMRKMHETRNFSGLLGLIEEAQSMANRMEAALHDNKDTANAREILSKLKKEVAALEARKTELGAKDEN